MKVNHFFIGLGVLGACIILFSSFKKSDDKDIPEEKSAEGKSANEIDTKGMIKYIIEIPSALRSSLFDKGEFFDAILKVPYSFESIGAGGSKGIAVNIKLHPENLKKMDDILKTLNEEISIKQV